MSIQRLPGNNDDKYFHSSGYAKVARGDQIGTTSAQSFSERNHAERSRKMVRRYHDSMVARHGDRTIGSSKIDITRPQERPGPPPNPSRQETNAAPLPPRPQTFREPPTRGYNPFS